MATPILPGSIPCNNYSSTEKPLLHFRNINCTTEAVIT